MPTLQRKKRAYQKIHYRENANIQHAERGNQATYNKTYYAKNSEKLESMARGAARAQYRANPHKKKASARAQYTAAPNKKKAAARVASRIRYAKNYNAKLKSF